MVLAMLVFCSSANAQDWSRERLNKSPRHHEWVTVKQGNRQVQCFLAYPEVKGKAPAVVVIHENRGLTDWVRSVADQLAEHGYIAIAPDLLSGMGPKGGRTSDFADESAARDALYKLDAQQITADLDAVVETVAKLKACNGKVAVAGFCWGGAQTFQFATQRRRLAAAFVFYGTAPKSSETFKQIACPVYGFYGGNDARVNETVPGTAEAMKQAGKTFEPVTYEGAGHGFMRSGEAPDATEPNKKARDEAWKRWLNALKKM